MSTYIFFYRKIDIGGCQLLIEKLGEKLADNSNDVYCCCEQVTDIMRERLEKAKIKIWLAPSWNGDYCIRNWIFHFQDDIRIISFIWVDYSRLSYIVRKRAKILFYAIHFDAVKIATWHSNKIVKAFRFAMLKNTIKKLMEKNSIVFMNEQAINSTFEYYKNLTDQTMQKCKILRIPTREKLVDVAEMERIVDNKKPILLAVARADFPFKGYLLGLIELMKAGKLPQNYELHIVSYGDDIKLLEEAYKNCLPEIKSKIKIYGKRNQEELYVLYEKSKLYVGMGTTVLDATQNGAISVLVVSNTNKVLVSGYYFEDYNKLGADEGTEEMLINICNEVDKLSNEDYLKRILCDINVVNQRYGSNHIAEELENIFDEGCNENVPIMVKNSYLIRNFLRSILNIKK